MPDYTVKNLMEIEDSSGGRLPGLQARFARKYLDSEELGVSHFTYAPNCRPPFGHSHREQEEAYVVVGGSGRMKLDDDIIELRRWDVVRVAPSVVRGFESGPEGLEVIAIGGRRPQDGDGVRVQDWWTD